LHQQKSNIIEDFVCKLKLFKELIIHPLFQFSPIFKKWKLLRFNLEWSQRIMGLKGWNQDEASLLPDLFEEIQKGL